MAAELPFVGRLTERAGFSKRLKEGRGGTILLVGEEGIGKSRLLRVWMDEAAAAGRQVGFGPCTALGQPPAFYPWRLAIRQYSAVAGLPTDALPQPFGQAPAGDLLALAEALMTFFTAGPDALIALDDLHWADASSLELLSCMTALPDKGAPLVVASLRPSPAVAQLVRIGAEYIPLGPLNEREVAQLAERAGKPGAAPAVYARAGGIPLYTIDLLVDGKPRLPQLPAAATELLQAAALLGEHFDASTAGQLAEMPEVALVGALEDAVSAGVVKEEGEGFRFALPLWREAMLESMLGLKRRMLHRRAAGIASQVQEAGDRAMREGERARAARLYGQALELLEPADARRPELLLLTGAACLATDPGLATAHLDEACRTQDPVVAALARYQLALHLPGRAARRGPRLMDEAHRELSALRHDRRLASLWELITGRPPHAVGAPDGLAQAYLWSGRPTEAEAIILSAMADGGESCRGAGDQWVLAEAALLRGDLAAAFEGYRRSVGEALERRDYLLAAQRAAHLHEEFLRNCADRKEEARELKAWAAELTGLAQERAGSTVDPWAPHRAEWQVWQDVEQGKVEQAQRRLKELLAPVRPGGAPHYGDYGRKLRLMIGMARVLRAAGDLEGATAWLSTVDQWLAGPRPSALYQAYSQLEWAELHRVAGDPEAARQAAERALEAGQRFGSTTGLVQPALALLAGSAPRPRRRSDQPLTRREAEVVRLVAQGLTDREVGARLFLSPRTIDGHLRNVFTKLGVQSRAALAAWAARSGMFEDP